MKYSVTRIITIQSIKALRPIKEKLVLALLWLLFGAEENKKAELWFLGRLFWIFFTLKRTKNYSKYCNT